MLWEARLYNKEVKALVETPEDPKTHRGDRDDYATFTCWPGVVKVLEEVLQHKRISLDQGALQHPRRKPTCLWSNFPMARGHRNSTAFVKVDGSVGANAQRCHHSILA